MTEQKIGDIESAMNETVDHLEAMSQELAELKKSMKVRLSVLERKQ